MHWTLQGRKLSGTQVSDGSGGEPRADRGRGISNRDQWGAYSLSEVAVSSLIFPSPWSDLEMEEQQQAGEQQQHRGAGGSGGRGGAGAAAQGPHHGGCLTQNGTPPAGNPGHPRRGVAAATSAVATPASSPASVPSQGIRGGPVEREKERGCKGWLESCSSSHWGGAQRGPARKESAGGEPGSRGGASLRDAARRKQSSARWGPAGGCRAQAPGSGGAVLPEPTPPSPASPPAAPQPPAASGSVLRRGQSRARGPAAADSSRHAPAGTPPQGGGGGGGERVRRGAGKPIVPTRPEKSGRARVRGAGSREAAGEDKSSRRFPASQCPPAAQRASSSRPREGSREGGGGSAHAARSFRRRRRCPNRGRPREKEAK